MYFDRCWMSRRLPTKRPGGGEHGAEGTRDRGIQIGVVWFARRLGVCSGNGSRNNPNGAAQALLIIGIKMSDRPIAEIIDDLLAAPKTMDGVPDWQDAPYRGEQRIVMPLRIDGVSTGADLLITSYPFIGHTKFRIMINADKCVWRIDHVMDEPHINSFDKPPDLLEFDFNEPHYHSWQDNRRFCTHFSLPNELQNARIMPAHVRTFDSSLRWFCGETNIEQPPNGLIDLPPRRRLL